ncbi:membrane bound O-acyl transferase family-domain-containing protein [Xylariaceae sp. FL1272]|nr:membrane bound O-acyl transferase family-domain-containing protein [Xylariaceae sp. FL1272]
MKTFSLVPFERIVPRHFVELTIIMTLAENYLEPVAFSMIPVTLWMIAFAFFHSSLHSSHLRVKCLCLLFVVLSFTRSIDFPPEIQPIWANATIVSLLHAMTFFFCRRNLEAQHNRSKQRTWPSPSSSWRLWTNYRDLPRDFSPTHPRKQQSMAFFLLLQLFKLSLYYQLRYTIEPKAFTWIIGSLRSEDVISLTLLGRMSDLSSRKVRIQSFFAIHWVFMNFTAFDGLHAVLAIIHVSSGFDRPEQWPPLFGTMENACGLRNFWSRFWHRLAQPSYKSVAHGIIRRLPRSFCESKAAVAFMVFLVSGCAHALASNILGENGWLDIKWYLLNFVACSAETAIMRAVRHLACRLHWEHKLKEVEASWLGRFIGFSWVFGFFFTSVPLWQFPRIRNSLITMENDAEWEQWEQWQSLLEQRVKKSIH